MIQPIPRQSLADPDFYTEEFQWLNKWQNGYPCSFPVVPVSGWSNVTTTVLVSTASEYHVETTYVLNKPKLGGSLVLKESVHAIDETVSPYGTLRVTTSDKEFYFQKS